MRRVLETGERRDLDLTTPIPGQPRPLAWSIVFAPLLDDEGRVAGLMLSAHDMTGPRTARQRLTLLNEASVRIGSTLDIDRTAQELADVAIPALADFVTVDLLPTVHEGSEPRPGPPGGYVLLRRVAAQSVFAGVPEAVLRPGQVTAYPDFSPAAECLKAERAMLYRDTDPGVARWAAEDPDRAAMVRRFGFHSTMAVPLRARGVTLGVATFSRHRRPEPFEHDDLLLAEEMTARPPSASTTPGGTPMSGTPRCPSSAVCCRAPCPRAPRWSWRPAIGRAPPGPGWAATGSTSSGWRARGSPWSSAMWWAMASARRRPWGGCGRRCAPSPTSICPPMSCSPIWTI